MLRRPLLRLVGITGLLVGGWLLVAGPAVAQTTAAIDDVGWWTRLKQEPTLGGALVFPDVNTGQLLVEGTPEGATAIAALRATLPEGSGNAVLTLRAASAVGAEAAVLLACQSGSGWTGAHGGAWDAKPSPDCSQSVQGIPSDDGSEFTFALGALQFDDQLDIVLTPGVTAGGEAVGSTFRIVFDRPTEGSIELGPAPTSAPDVPDPALGAPPSTPGGGASGPPGSGSSSFAPPPSPSFSAPPAPTDDQLARQPARAALPATEQGQTATAPSLTATRPLEVPTAPIGSAGGDGRLLGIVVVLAAAGILYWTSQMAVPERQVLSRFAAATTGANTSQSVATPAPVEGGLGRFRRVRTTPARRIG